MTGFSFFPVNPSSFLRASRRMVAFIIVVLLLTTAELAVEPMGAAELAQVGYQVLPFYQAIIIDGMKATDGRCFLRGMDMELGQMCLYVVIPLQVGTKIERYEYKVKK